MAENPIPRRVTPPSRPQLARFLRLVLVTVAAGLIVLSGCSLPDGGEDEESATSMPPSPELDTVDDRRPPAAPTTAAPRTKKKDRPSTTTTTRKSTPRPKPKPTTTTTTEPDEEECETYSDTRYLPARSAVTFERNGVTVDVQRVWHRYLTLEVTSSDGKYRHTRVDPDTVLYEGLIVTTSQLHMDWTWDYFKEEFVLEPGQVDTVLRVFDCWTYVNGPDDLW